MRSDKKLLTVDNDHSHLKSSIFIRFLFAIVLFFPGYASSIEITITPQVIMNFGSISDANGTCQLKSNGTLRGLNGQDCSGSGVRGEYLLQGDPNTNFTLILTGSNSNGITFTPVVNGAPKRFSSTGDKTIVIVGELVLNNPGSGAQSPSFTLSVNY